MDHPILESFFSRLLDSHYLVDRRICAIFQKDNLVQQFVPAAACDAQYFFPYGSCDNLPKTTNPLPISTVWRS